MEEFEPSSMLGIGNGGVRFKLKLLESGMEEFDSNFNSWNREWRSSSKCSKLEIGNRAVTAKFRSLETGIEEFEPSSNFTRTLPFPIPSVGTLLKLLHFRFQASNLALTLPIRILSHELCSNSSIPDPKRRNLSQTPPFPIPSLELDLNSSIPDSKPRT